MFIAYMIKELDERAGGNPFDNRNVIYNGTLDDHKTNAEIARYAADPEALAYLRNFYTPTGRIQHPMLAIHTSYDPLVPVWIPNNYPTTLQNAGTENLFVQQYVNHDGHCAICRMRSPRASRNCARGRTRASVRTRAKFRRRRPAEISLWPRMHTNKHESYLCNSCALRG